MKSYDSLAEMYKHVGRKLLTEGETVCPRGLKTKELLSETFCIENPANNLIYSKERKFSLMHALNEAVLLAYKTNSLESYAMFNENMRNFSDDGTILHGAYGYRISPYVQSVVDRLKQDVDTRQAVINIYDKTLDFEPTKDVPCTLVLHFMIRNNKLNLHVYMRSNDIVWGTPYDVFMFTNLQMVIANTLGIEVGKYFHTASSLHVYETTQAVLESLIEGQCDPIAKHNNLNLKDWIDLGCALEDAKRYFVGTEGEAHPQIWYADWFTARNAEYFNLFAKELLFNGKMNDELLSKFINNRLHGNDNYAWAKNFTARWKIDG